MTVSFLEMLGADTVSPDSPLSHAESSAVRGTPLLAKVGEVLPHRLTDGEREAAIGLAASLVEYHMELYEISGCFTDRGNADRARLSMEALIKGRSAEAIARMEQERGLV